MELFGSQSDWDQELTSNFTSDFDSLLLQWVWHSAVTRDKVTSAGCQNCTVQFVWPWTVPLPCRFFFVFVVVFLFSFPPLNTPLFPGCMGGSSSFYPLMWPGNEASLPCTLLTNIYASVCKIGESEASLIPRSHEVGNQVLSLFCMAWEWGWTGARFVIFTAALMGLSREDISPEPLRVFSGLPQMLVANASWQLPDSSQMDNGLLLRLYPTYITIPFIYQMLIRPASLPHLTTNNGISKLV